MKVRLIIYSNLKDYVEGYNEKEGLNKEIEGEKTVKEFLQETIRHKKAMEAISMVLINEKFIPFNQLERKLQDGDVVKIFPPIGGG